MAPLFNDIRYGFLTKLQSPLNKSGEVTEELGASYAMNILNLKFHGILVSHCILKFILSLKKVADRRMPFMCAFISSFPL